MSAIAREKIFDELRHYHVSTFPEKLSSERMDNFKAQFGEIEDKVISMLLGLVDGKAVFTDSTKELNEFRQQIDAPSTAKNLEQGNQDFFDSKINWLLSILEMAKGSDFQLTKVRTKKAA